MSEVTVDDIERTLSGKGAGAHVAAIRRASPEVARSASDRVALRNNLSPDVVWWYYEKIRSYSDAQAAEVIVRADNNAMKNRRDFTEISQ